MNIRHEERALRRDCAAVAAALSLSAHSGQRTQHAAVSTGARFGHDEGGRGRTAAATTATAAAMLARDDDDDDDTVKERRTGVHWQRNSNRPRGMSCPGSPAHLRPTSSCRDHSSHFHVPRSRSRRPSSLGERRNVRISASPDVDSAAAVRRCGGRVQANQRSLFFFFLHWRCGRPANHGATIFPESSPPR